MNLGKLAKEEYIYLIILAAFDFLIIPFEVMWLHRYYKISNHKIDPAGRQRHKCITLRHYRITWAYLTTALFACNIAHPLSIIVYYLHSTIPTPTIICSYLLSDIATLSVLYLCLIRAYMILWDKKYNLARKEQFWKTQIRNDNLGDNAYEPSSSGRVLENDEKSTNFWIKYRNQRYRLISMFLGIVGPLTLLITISPFILYPSSISSTRCRQAHRQTFDSVRTHSLCPQFTISSGLRILLSLPIVIILGVIWWKIPKFNEAMGIKYEIKSIILIVMGTFLLRDVVVTGMLYICAKLIDGRFLMLINGNINMLSAFLLFFTSTGFILPKLRRIMFGNKNQSGNSSSITTSVSDTPLVPIGNATPVTPSMLIKEIGTAIGTRLGMVNTTSHDGAFPDIDVTTMQQPKLTKTMRIWRHRRDRTPLHENHGDTIGDGHHHDGSHREHNGHHHIINSNLGNKGQTDLTVHTQREHEHSHQSQGDAVDPQSGSPSTLESGDGIQQNMDSGDSVHSIHSIHSGDGTKSGIHFSIKHGTPDTQITHYDHEHISSSHLGPTHPISQQRSSESRTSTQPQAMLTVTGSPSRGAFDVPMLLSIYIESINPFLCNFNF